MKCKSMNPLLEDGGQEFKRIYMKLINISQNSLKRRKARMIFLVLGLVIAISTMVVMFSISEAMNTDIATKLDEFGANILIVPKTESLNLSYAGMSVSGLEVNSNKLYDEDVSKIMTIKNKDNISIIAPKLIEISEINKKKILVVGVDFNKESSLKKWWSIIGSAPANKDEVLIGANAKQSLNTGLNDIVYIKEKPFLISGILKDTGSQDDDLLFMDLGTAQQIFNKPESISLIEVAALCYDCPIEDIVAQTSDKLPTAKVTAIRQTIQSKMEAIGHFQNFSIGISAIVLLVSALIVFTTLMASVNERVREIGIFRAIGFRQSHILQIILTEAFIVSLFSGIIGYFLGLLLANSIAILLGIDNQLIIFDEGLLGFATALSIITGVLSGLYPAIKAARLDPVEALRTI